MDLQLGGDVFGDDLGSKTAWRLALAPFMTVRSTTRRTCSGRPRSRWSPDGGLEPGPGPAGAGRTRRCRRPPAGLWRTTSKAGPAVVGGEGVGHTVIMRPQQPPQVARAEPGAYVLGGGGVFDRAKAVVQGRIGDAGAGQLGLGPFVAVGHGPSRVGGVAARPSRTPGPRPRRRNRSTKSQALTTCATTRNEGGRGGGWHGRGRRKPRQQLVVSCALPTSTSP